MTALRAGSRSAAASLSRAVWWHPWLVTVALCVAVLMSDMRGPDLPAADLRAWLVREGGFTVWNDQWYGGHPTVGYSLLSPLVGAAVGVSLAGALSCVVASIAVTRLCRDQSVRAVRIGALWFCVVIVTGFVVGQVPFLLGVAAGLWAMLAWTRHRPVWAALAAAACSLASPLAGAFLLLGAVAWASVNRWRDVVPFGAALCGLILAYLAGGGGTFPLTLATLIPVGLLVVLGLHLAPPSYRALRRGLILYGAATGVLALVPTPVGGNIGRLGALAAGPVTGAILLHLGRRFWMALLSVPLLAWPVCPAVVAIANSGDDPSRHEEYYAGLTAFLQDHQRPYGRVEIPMTRDHWEAAYVAPVYPLARGWERQIDRRYNLVFYRDRLTVKQYRAWLDDNAVRYVALPDVALDFAGAREGRLLEGAAIPWLRPVWSGAHWQVWEVRDAAPLTSGAGVLKHLGVDNFTLHQARAGSTVVRLHHSRMWHTASPGVCISGTGDGWMRVTSNHPGEVKVAARPSLAAFAGPFLRDSSEPDEHCSPS